MHAGVESCSGRTGRQAEVSIEFSKQCGAEAVREVHPMLSRGYQSPCFRGWQAGVGVLLFRRSDTQVYLSSSGYCGLLCDYTHTFQGCKSRCVVR
jgi:hypothetical protein